VAVSAYAAALVANSEGGKVLSECAPAAEKIKKKDWPQKVPLPLAVAMGQAHLQASQMDQAAAINEALLKWPFAGAYPGTVEFRNQFRLAQAEARLRADNSAQAHAEHAR